MLTTTDDVKQAIEAVVRDRLNAVEIVNVNVSVGEDYEGEEVYFVEIVFDADVAALDPQRLSGLNRHIRGVLEKFHDERFAHTKLMSRADFEGAAA